MSRCCVCSQTAFIHYCWKHILKNLLNQSQYVPDRRVAPWWNPHPHLHRCCAGPEPPGGAHSTDTGPAHGPAVCSLPAAQKHAAPRSDSKTREIHHSHTERAHFSAVGTQYCLYLTSDKQTDKLRQWIIQMKTWDTDHMTLFGGFGHSIASLAVISNKWKGNRTDSVYGAYQFITSHEIILNVSH